MKYNQNYNLGHKIGKKSFISYLKNTLIKIENI